MCSALKFDLIKRETITSDKVGRSEKQKIIVVIKPVFELTDLLADWASFCWSWTQSKSEATTYMDRVTIHVLP